MLYKLRAECSHDIALFIQKAHTEFTEFKMVKKTGFPDVEFEFMTALELDEIELILEEIQDSHVMCQTVKPLDEYDGERNYNYP